MHHTAYMHAAYMHAAYIHMHMHMHMHMHPRTKEQSTRDVLALGVVRRCDVAVANGGERRKRPVERVKVLLGERRVDGRSVVV